MKIMFICTGNICRSAMAQAMLEKKLKENNIEAEVCSCGLFAHNGDIPTIEGVTVLDTIYDVDLTKHRATNIDNSNIKDMDIILCATTSHKNNVLNKFPELDGRVFTMKEFAKYPSYDLDINDPWGGSMATYKKCDSEINECLDKIINLL